MPNNLKLFVFVFLFSFTLTCLIIYYTEQYNPNRNLFLRYFLSNDRVIKSNGKKVNVFIDLGANKGDSLINFLNLTSRAQGGSLNLNIPDLSTDKQKWIIYLFEANDHFTKKLRQLKEDVERIGHIVYLHDQTAAWIHDGTIDFYLDTVNEKNDFWGSSLMKNHVCIKDFIFFIKNN
jgi:hypothetical protein